MGLLAVLFIALRLFGVINWSWWWILAPIWIPMVLAFLMVIAVITIVVIGDS